MATSTVPSLAWDHQVYDRANHIVEKLDENPEFSKTNAPGLRDLLSDFASPDVKVSDVDFHRRLLKVLKDSETDGTYSSMLKMYTPEEQEKIQRFVAGENVKDLAENFVPGPSLGCRQGIDKLQQAESIVRITHESINDIKKPGPEGDLLATFRQTNSVVDDWFTEAVVGLRDFFSRSKPGQEIMVYKNAKFQNWGLNVENTPFLTCIPSTTADIQSIVRYAKDNNMSVRCSGYRHSWSPIFGKDGQILISMLDLKTATSLPNIESLPLPQSSPTELQQIGFASGKPRVSGNKLVRVGCAVTNERLRRWCIKEGTVTIPLNVIMVEITLGGSNAPICHGAGRQNMTLSDLVRKVEYVDANGNLQTVEKPEHLRAASGCFGLMGVVTHITMEFPPMSYAQLDPKKIPVIQAVPPPPGLAEKDIPPALLKYWTPLSDVEKQKCQKDFEDRATNDYYAEWFWFPYSDFSWVNTWNKTDDPKGVESFPSPTQIILSFFETAAMNMVQNAPLFKELINIAHLSEGLVTIISAGAMKALPQDPVKTFLPDALHFQRAIQNVRVRDIEVEMPLVAKKGGHAGIIDYTPVQQAWWDAILLTYQNSDTCPMRMPLEMRIMGGSDVIMAPQRGNSLGTCSIEVLTLYSAREIWPKFAQSVLDKWMALKDPSTGEALKTRPHWAKEWYGYKVDGRPWVERLKAVDYKEERKEFLQTLAEIGKEAKEPWSLQDLQARFSNVLFDNFFFDGKAQIANGTSNEGK
ncbi:putative xylitol oxidase [Fusarium flagelliforme]|uniref:Putative xylitol oxidase n=1 Tax=Fusarium flagelliforme TaxID=2675880 RepID=A0A395N329_9HYPO|nr:putative xylitol oxidase [Fusarium flagelliforme]